MDNDVKIALQNLLNVCDENVKNILLNDIKQFIIYISTENTEERFNTFCKVYWSEKISLGVKDETGEVTVNALEYLCKKNERSEALIVSFFTVLGKSYIFSKYDKKSISKEKYLEYLKGINRSANMQKEAEITSMQKVQVLSEEKIEKECAYEKVQSNIVDDEPEESLEELMNQLHSLVGLDAVKQEVDQIVNLICLQKKAIDFGEKQVPLSLHLVFYGNPGTGKTTVARLLAKIYKSLGVLSTGQLVEVDRGGLVGGYVGQTAIKTQEVINKAIGGILFIDEVYALTHGKGESDFGQEAVDTILKAMEDNRDKFIVIVAGYPELMKEFIASNPGLKSRFSQYIDFEDYKPEELCEIFLLQCNNHNLVLGGGGHAYVTEHFTQLYANRTDSYANGRDVRNYFEQVYKMHANRLKPIIDNTTREEYRTLILWDLEQAALIKKTEW